MKYSGPKITKKSQKQAVATFGEERMRTVSQLLLWDPKHGRCLRGCPTTTLIYWPTTEWHWSFDARSWICHGQQTGTRQTYKISAGAPKMDR